MVEAPEHTIERAPTQTLSGLEERHQQAERELRERLAREKEEFETNLWDRLDSELRQAGHDGLDDRRQQVTLALADGSRVALKVTKLVGHYAPGAEVPTAEGGRARNGSASGRQRSQGRLTFRHVSVHGPDVDVLAIGRAAESVASRQETIGADRFSYKTTPREDGSTELTLKWTYGWVVGGYPSDGRRFVEQAFAKAGVRPVNPEPTVLNEERREVVA